MCVKGQRVHTECPRSSEHQFYVVPFHIKWVTTSWTDGSSSNPETQMKQEVNKRIKGYPS